MIKRTQQNAKSRNISATFKVADFKKLSKNFNTPFDAVLCIGNSLSHALTDNDVRQSVHEMDKTLDQDGLLILHLRNYQKMLRERRRFSVHRSDDDIFFYVWDFEPEYIVHIINYELKTDNIESCSFPFNPIKKNKLTRFLREEGFNILKFFGNYKFKELDAQEDDWLIIVCEK